MKIEELLAKHVLGILNEEEEKALRTWLDEDPAHEAYFRKLQSRHNYRELYCAYCEMRPQPVPVVRRFNWRHAAIGLPCLPCLYCSLSACGWG